MVQLCGQDETVFVASHSCKRRRRLRGSTRSRRAESHHLMSIHEHLRRRRGSDLKEVGWTKGLELAKVARGDGQHFDCATWLHKARRAEGGVQAGGGEGTDGKETEPRK